MFRTLKTTLVRQFCEHLFNLVCLDGISSKGLTRLLWQVNQRTWSQCTHTVASSNRATLRGWLLRVLASTADDIGSGSPSTDRTVPGICHRHPQAATTGKPLCFDFADPAQQENRVAMIPTMYSSRIKMSKFQERFAEGLNA